MSDHFNELTPAEAERLVVLIEECGEVIKAASKILRHGYESRNPDDGRDRDGLCVGPTNRRALEREMGDVRAAMITLCNAGDTSKDRIHKHADKKLVSVQDVAP